MRLQNKVAYISGGARGLGAEMARRLHDEGAKVMVSDILEDEGTALAADYPNMEFILCDVLDESQWQSSLAECVRVFGGLDVLVNNAGIVHNGETLEHTSLEQWRKVIGVDLDAVFLGCKYAIPLMKENGGSIINVSSIYGIVGSAGQSPYHAAKGGVRLMTKSLAIEMGREGYNIRVNSIHPGFVMTELVRDGIRQSVEHGTMPSENEAIEQLTAQIPSGRMGVPRDIADGVVFLASDESVWMNGAELVIDGGFTAQ